MQVVRKFRITVGNLQKEKGEGRREKGVTLNKVRNITVKKQWITDAIGGGGMKLH